MNYEEAQELIEEFHVPKHIRRHCEQVAKICKFLGERMPGVNLELLENAALLHDLVRICDFTVWNPSNMPDEHSKESKKKWEEIRKQYLGKPHEQAVYEILSERGERELANLVKSHRFANIIDGELKTWEEKILYYADKRVEGDEIVPLQQRLEKGKKRNAITPEQKRISDLAVPKILALEKEICEKAGIEPEDIR